MAWESVRRVSMLAILSSSKTLDESPCKAVVDGHEPLFGKETTQLVHMLSHLSIKEIERLMGISTKLATLNHERFSAIGSHDNLTKQALAMYKGDVYEPLELSSYTKKMWQYADGHIRIVSGLYGLLRPSDWIEPYRLEMASKLSTPRGKDLYQFWGDKLSDILRISLRANPNPVVINLASQEYSKSVVSKKNPLPMIDMIFQDYYHGEYKVIGLLAKRARGLMTHYMISNMVTKPEDLKNFDLEGYHFRKTLSNEHKMVFQRNKKA